MKSRNLWRIIPFALLVLAPGAALADPITLVCVSSDMPNYPWTIALDTAAGTANGIAAAFTEQEITWYDGANNSNYTLNRVSGNLKIENANGQHVTIYSCHPGNKQF